MSQHPSLRSQDKDKQHRSVLKRYERVKVLKDKGLWKEEDSVFGLPKVKIAKFKIKKEKAKTAEAVGAAEEGAPAGAASSQPQGQAKAAPESKAAPSKESKKI